MPVYPEASGVGAGVPSLAFRIHGSLVSSQLEEQLEALAQGLGERLRLGITLRETGRPLARDTPTVSGQMPGPCCPGWPRSHGQTLQETDNQRLLHRQVGATTGRTQTVGAWPPSRGPDGKKNIRHWHLQRPRAEPLDGLPRVAEAGL